MLVRSDSVWKLAFTSLESKLWSSSANVKESLLVCLLVDKGSSTGTKNFAILYVGVLMTEKISLKSGGLSVTIFLDFS